MNSRQPPNNVLLLSGTINEEDNARSVAKWLKSGELTPKLFKKHLRHTAKDISQGHRDSYEVMWGLMESIWVGKSEEASLLRALSSALTTAVLPQSSSPTKRLEVEAILGSFFFYNMHRKDSRGSVIDVKPSLVDAVKRIRSFVMTNDQWADTVSGSFRSTSPVYKLTETEFVDNVYGELAKVNTPSSTEELWHECEKMRRTANALSRLCENCNPIFYTCWECDKIFVNVLHCGKCKAALYCSRKCQVAAWKGGHKGKCGRLKLMHEHFLANVEEVQRVHVTGVQDGLLLSPKRDCVTIRLCMGFEYIGSQALHIQGSMKSFYENLGRIHRGEWWVYDLSNQDNYADSATTDENHPDLCRMLRLLAIDWFDYTRLTLGTVSVDSQQVTDLTDPFFRSECGTPISAKTLLEMYCAVESETLFRPDFKVESYKWLRFVYDDLENCAESEIRETLTGGAEDPFG